MKPDVSLETLWNAVIARLPPIPYPFTIKTMAETPVIFEEGSDKSVALSLTHCDTDVLNLLLNINDHCKACDPAFTPIDVHPPPQTLCTRVSHVLIVQ